MTKAKISQYDAVASNNTDVNGVNIAEGCPPSGMNNMGREIMAALKRFQVGSDGDGVTVGGNLVVSGSSTLSTTSISSADINAGTIDGTAIGGSTPAAGSFTTLNTSGAVVFNDAGADVDFRVEGDTDPNLLFVDAGNDNVGIGASNPDLFSFGSTYKAFAVQNTTSNGNTVQYLIANGTGGITLQFTNETYRRAAIGNDSSSNLTFSTNGSNSSATGVTERMRIDSSGNFMVATTGNVAASGAGGNEGFYYQADDFLAIARSGGQVVYLNRLDSDGDILEFRKDGSPVGKIGSISGLVSYIVLDPRVGGAGMRGGSTSILPANEAGAAVNDAIDLGTSATRWQDIYLVNSPNVSSDRNLKQDIEELSEAEQRVAVACKALLRKWRFKDAVAKKGDDARIHFGIIAQDLKAAFEAEGLDAHRYGMFMWNEWWETQTEVPAVEAQEAVYETQTDEEGNEVQVLVSEAVEGKDAYTRTDTYETEEEAPEGAVRKERMGIRYNELLAFIIAAL